MLLSSYRLWVEAVRRGARETPLIRSRWDDILDRVEAVLPGNSRSPEKWAAIRTELFRIVFECQATAHGGVKDASDVTAGSLIQSPVARPRPDLEGQHGPGP